MQVTSPSSPAVIHSDKCDVGSSTELMEKMAQTYTSIMTCTDIITVESEKKVGGISRQN